MSDYPQDGEDLEQLHMEPQRYWEFDEENPICLVISGQPAIYAQKFIRTRMAEEAMVVKQHGRR